MRRRPFAALLGLVLLAACATPPKPYDYTNYRAHLPRSILVLPPLNNSTAVEATYGCYTTVTRPLAEMGYYVYPVAEVDAFFKENGTPGAAEMQQVPLDRIRSVMGADAVLYLTVKDYGSKYVVVKSIATVTLAGKLVDTATGTLLWEGTATAQEQSGGSGLAALVQAVVTQVVNSSVDRSHRICGPAHALLFGVKDHGLLPGPYRPAGQTP